MPGYFEQIIFPPKPKPVVTERPSIRESSNIDDVKARAMFEHVYCSKKDAWFSMLECINCGEANRKLEEIMEDGVGCIGE